MEHYLTNHVETFSTPSPRSLSLKLFHLILCWQERWLQRRRLEQMDDSFLRDIGLTRADIHQEVRKPFWQD
ncbi:MAG: DUF1127 domain-containing protein [Kiloniellales bacterium]